MSFTASWRWPRGRGRGVGAPATGEPDSRRAGAAPATASPRSPHAALAEAQAIGARLPALLVAAEQVASTVAQGVHGRRRAGMGDSFWQYRAAVPGEPATRIDWRQSARSSRAYVREMEWEAAQTVCLWPDLSPSMRWRSTRQLPTKLERAELLLLALASLALRGGEHVRLATGAGRTGRVSGQHALARLGDQLLHAGALAEERDTSPGLPDPALELPRRSRLVLVGDLLAPPDRIEALFVRLSAMPVGCHVLQVLDPAELDMPYRGRVRFEGLEGEAPMLVPRAEDVRGPYLEALHRHQEALAALCRNAGFGLTLHRTDTPPQTALLDLHQALSAQRAGAPAAAVRPVGSMS
ncbi:DUF58 domain-containing protein [Lichenicoccus roseus]|uniref:DUF58 domain-containing protein n=1 Tax=Lichenicoccus roseus TaxID=2683649 RepID=A0A5R9JC41_9PROT|nr:DUF58 domain-containing protein [Lichenicoccus roseus]TLU73181.1 DUF58 domain-containing protein [Lichenicoccus roseus]